MELVSNCDSELVIVNTDFLSQILITVRKVIKSFTVEPIIRLFQRRQMHSQDQVLGIIENLIYFTKK